MGKTIRTLATLLGIGLCLWGCSDNPAVRLRYEAEKQYYAAEKFAQGADLSGSLDDPAVARSIRDQYGTVVEFCFAALDTITPEKHPQENRQLSGIAYQSTTRLAQMYFSARRFDTLATLLDRLIAKATLPRSEQATSLYNYGRALQVGRKWDSAMSVFSNALDQFSPPVNDSGHVLLLIFNLPIRIHKAYLDGRDPNNQPQWFSRAEAYYQKWSGASSGPTELSMTSLGNLARLYEDAGMWESAAAALSKMRDSTGAVAAVPKLHIADLYAEKLDRPDDAIAMYRELATVLVGPDTMSRPGLLEKEAVAYMAKKDYGHAREILTDLSSRWPRYFAASSKAQYNKARCFELEKNWNRAETEYRFLIDHYAGSEEALATYLYLAQRASDDGRTAEATLWYERAEKAYKAQATQKAGTSEEALALYFLAELQRVKKDWASSAKTLTLVFAKFPLTAPGQRAAIMAAEVYRDKLNDSRTADSLMVAMQEVMVSADSE
jgi:tetratricopeptide (TPR) repeat protein